MLRLADYLDDLGHGARERIQGSVTTLQILPGIQVTRPADAESLEVKRDFARVFISDRHREISQ